MKNQPVLPISHNNASKGHNPSPTPSALSSISKYRLVAATLLVIWLVFKLCGSGSDPSPATPSYPPSKRPASDYIELADFDNNGEATADAITQNTTKILVTEFVQTEPISDNDADPTASDEIDYDKVLTDDLAMEDFVLDEDDVPEEEYVIPDVPPKADEAVQQVNDIDVEVETAVGDDGSMREENDLDGVPSFTPEEDSEETDSVVPELEAGPGDEEDYESYEEELDIVHDDDDYEFLEQDDDDENFATPQLKEIYDTVMAHSVVIYGKSDCPYTERAKAIFARYEITPHVVEVDTLANPAEMQDALVSLTLRATLPNIFVDGTTIGGSGELAKLDANGGLKRILQDAKLLPRENESDVEL